MSPEPELLYTTPVTSARAESGQEASPASIGSYSVYTTVGHPNTEKLIEGWHWDQRVWSEESVENSAMYIPTNWDPTVSGITTTYFQSGIGSGQDLKLESIEYIPSSGVNEPGVFNLWSPKINHGYYYDFEEQHYLFSDDSEVYTFCHSGMVFEQYNELTILTNPKVGIPSVVRQLKWDNQLGKYNVERDFRKKIYFTGLRDEDGARLSTYNSNSEAILWENIDQTVDEFIITFSGVEPKVILNQQCSETVGNSVTLSGLEFLGYSDGTANQQFHTLYAPIDSTENIEVYSYVTISGVSTEWTPIDFNQTPTGNQVKVDYDLGILEFGDPDEPGQNVPPAGYSIGVTYNKTCFFEYEPDYTDNTITALEANINPIYRKGERGFIYLSTQYEDAASITLETTLPELSTNVFGPLNIGNTYVPVIATVKDSKDQLLENQTVKFFITSTPVAGSFGGTNPREINAITDIDGQAISYYVPPKSIEDIGENITASNWSTTSNPSEYPDLTSITTLQTNRILIDGTINDIFLYESHIDDLFLGYRDITESVDYSTQLSSYYTDFFDDNEINGQTRNLEWEDMHRTIWNLARPAIFASDAPGQFSGRKKIVAAIDSTVLNPYTFTYGAVSPIQPYDIVNLGDNQFDVVFDTSVNSIPKPTASDTVPYGTLYSYFLVAPTTVKLQASVFNERLNQHILSNEISIKLRIPSYASGQWIMDSINQTHIDEISDLLSSVTASGQKVPLGFRLRSSNITLAAALDSVTFLDINRPYNYNPYDETTISGIHLMHQVTVSGIS